MAGSRHPAPTLRKVVSFGPSVLSTLWIEDRPGLAEDLVMTRVWVGLALLLSACGSAEDLRLESKIEQTARIELRAPTQSGNCDTALAVRFCEGDYETLGVVDIPPRGVRTLGLREEDLGECAQVLWLRVLALDEVGPIQDPGTVFQVPTDVDLEYGSGALHTAAFPQGIIRLDEVGPADRNQALPPSACL